MSSVQVADRPRQGSLSAPDCVAIDSLSSGHAAAALRVPAGYFGGEFLVPHEQRAHDRIGYKIAKRCLDITISVAALLVLSPLLILAAVAVKLCDGGPVLFTQDRVGRGGRIFRCLKFRSMVLNAESLLAELAAANDHKDPRTFKMIDDPRITPVGRVLRRFSIDEFPQILNVLLGHMSIVGPRPPLPHEVELYSEKDLGRLAVRPGLTCTWQVSGRSSIPFSEQVKMDLDYIRHRSLQKDLQLILLTVPAVLTGNGAS